MPRKPLTHDSALERLELVSGGAEGYRAAAADYEAWAAEPHPDDEITVAGLLVSAGEALEFAGDREGALDCFRRAVADGSEVAPDVRCYVIGGLMNLGRFDEADAAAAELLRTRPRDPLVYEHVGEQYEAVDHLDDANRWMTAGVVRLLGAEDVSVYTVLMLMRSRRRVRQALGFDEDEFDLIGRPLG